MSEKQASNGIGIGTVLFLVFLVLKLTEVGTVATWSWWWVTSPLWIPLAFILVLLIGVGLIGLIASIVNK
jgi:hypothetical protein